MGRRRILLLITDLEIGGTPTVVREIALRLRDEAEIEVACLSRWGPVADQLRDANVAVHALGARGPHDIYVIRDLIRLIRTRQYDTIFSFLIHANTAAAIASRFCREPRLIQSIQTTQRNPRWHWTLQRFVQLAAKKIVVPSPSAARAARDWADVAEDRIVVIPNAVDLGAQTPSPGTPGEGRGGSCLRIGFIGRLDPIKRVPDLVRAIALLDDQFVLHIYGEGNDRSKIESEVSRLNLSNRVTLHGAVARPQAALDQIDLLVLPSEAEGFGLVLIEAMASCVPVVATDVMGIRDVVSNEVNGLLVPVGRPDELARAIRRIAESEPLRDRLVQGGLEAVRARFDWSVVLPQYRSLLKLEPS